MYIWFNIIFGDCNLHVTHHFDIIFILQHTKVYFELFDLLLMFVSIEFLSTKSNTWLELTWWSSYTRFIYLFALFLHCLKSFPMFYFYIASKLMFKTVKSHRLIFVKNAFANKGGSSKLYKINYRKKNFILNPHCRTVE